ncbi:MAG: hypothetical protein JNM91_10425, partial [Flavobacteriales bacterium]|nr:hypothetical protein [Flavobacteriales bacterium]
MWNSLMRGLLDGMELPYSDGSCLWVASDSSEKAGHFIDSILCVEESTLGEWEHRRRIIRDIYELDDHGLHYKELHTNSNQWPALHPTLEAAILLRGVCIVVALPRSVRQIAEVAMQAAMDNGAGDMEHNWKAWNYMNYMRHTALVASLIGELSSPGQDVHWLSDHEPPFNKPEMTQDIVSMFLKALRINVAHELGETTLSTPLLHPDATGAKRDLLAIPDLAAGGIGDALFDIRNDPAQDATWRFGTNERR